MITLGSVVLGVDDLERAKAFWMAALDYVELPGGDETWSMLAARSGSGQRISLMLSETPVQEHPRIHLDIYADGEKGPEAARLIALGATDVNWDSYPAEPDFVVLADTEGNRFCIVDGEAQTPA